MKKQQKTYLLLAGVLIIWGVIGYQIFSQLNPIEKTSFINNKETEFVPVKRIEQEKYIVKANYRDPFLGKTHSNKRVKPGNNTAKKKEIIPFPSVVYTGIVEGKLAKSYIITVNGKQEILKINQTFDNITLLRANGKEATIKFNSVIKKVSIE